MARRCNIDDCNQGAAKSLVLKSTYYNKYLMLANAKERPEGFLNLMQRTRAAHSQSLKRRMQGDLITCKGILYHIKCDSNTNYLVQDPKSSGDPHWIVAAAEDTVEEKSDDSCSLFEWVTDCDGQFRLRHVGSARYARVQTSGPLVAGLRLGSDSPDEDDKRYLFTAVSTT